MEACRSPKQSTYESASCVCLLFVLILIAALLSGCANVTVVKLAELCHANSGKPSITFAGESGKADCK
jgi:uncharacterized protein YceK